MNWVQYKNGNYDVCIDLDTGTKIRKNDLDFFAPETIESMDIKITNRCNMGCPMCHENSTPDGEHGDILSPSFLDNLHPYTELAIGGGNPLEHPDIDEFLKRCKERKFICNITVNQKHFVENYDRIKNWVDNKLVYGVGISLTKPNPKFIKLVTEIPNAVIHVIAGLVDVNTLHYLAYKDLKILVLGYKKVRRGENLYSENGDSIDKGINSLRAFISLIIKDKWFKVVSFDNLALKQLDIKEILTDEQWQEFYMGDDGQSGEQTSASMFVDMVERKFAKNSCAAENDRYNLLDTVEEMYAILRGIDNGR